jgi:hypothetical protein
VTVKRAISDLANILVSPVTSVRQPTA